MTSLKISRRNLFKFVAASGLAVPVAYVASQSVGHYGERPGLKNLTEKQAAIIDSIAEVIIPEGNELGIAPKDIQLVNQVDEFVGIMPANQQKRLGYLLWSVEHLFPMRCFYFTRFTKLDVRRRKIILENFDTENGTAGRALVRALKGLVQAVFYNDPRVAKAIQFLDKCHA